MSDMRLEKCLEAVYDQMLSSLPERLRDKCPAAKCVGVVLAALKTETTAEVAVELGLVDSGRWKCPCRPHACTTRRGIKKSKTIISAANQPYDSNS